MAKKNKYDLEYLYMSYKKHYKKADMQKAKTYNDLAQKIHNVNLDTIYHDKLAKREEKYGVFGIGKYKKIKYG
jgi:hypothetical protein